MRFNSALIILAGVSALTLLAGPLPAQTVENIAPPAPVSKSIFSTAKSIPATKSISRDLPAAGQAGILQGAQESAPSTGTSIYGSKQAMPNSLGFTGTATDPVSGGTFLGYGNAKSLINLFCCGNRRQVEIPCVPVPNYGGDYCIGKSAGRPLFGRWCGF